MSKFIRVSPANIDLHQSGFNVSFTDDFNVLLNGKECSPAVLLAVAKHIVSEHKKIEDRRKIEYIESNTRSYSFYPELIGKKEGVYSIDDFYVGRSMDVKNRIKQHIWQALNGKHCNKELQRRIQEKYKNDESLLIWWKECQSNDYEEGKLMAGFIDSGADLVNVDLKNFYNYKKLN